MCHLSTLMLTCDECEFVMRMRELNPRDLDIQRVYNAEVHRPGYVLELSPRHQFTPKNVTGSVSIGDRLAHKSAHKASSPA